jgi:hypothetical protein
MLSRRIGGFRGETLYAGYYEDMQRALLFTRPGEVPWIPVSQKQYLDGLAIHYREQLGETSGEMDQFVRDLEAQLEEIKRTTTGETRDQLVAGMEQAIAEVKAQQPKNAQNFDAGIAEAQAYIDDYLATHSEQEMQQPAFLLQGQDMNFLGEFTDEADGGHMIVRVDQDYFRDDVPPETAQTIMLFWGWELWEVNEEVDVSGRWRASFERNFPIDRLRAMVGS